MTSKRSWIPAATSAWGSSKGAMLPVRPANPPFLTDVAFGSAAERQDVRRATARFSWNSTSNHEP